MAKSYAVCKYPEFCIYKLKTYLLTGQVSLPVLLNLSVNLLVQVLTWYINLFLYKYILLRWFSPDARQQIVWCIVENIHVEQESDALTLIQMSPLWSWIQFQPCDISYLAQIIAFCYPRPALGTHVPLNPIWRLHMHLQIQYSTPRAATMM